mmetsp:Transcript_9512/g.28616  ORF Transcript_9512/g.28616 Transcript_9512/m.28616 type:complete len:218 (-) Transcript_9512:1441-2094(-)
MTARRWCPRCGRWEHVHCWTPRRGRPSRKAAGAPCSPHSPWASCRIIGTLRGSARPCWAGSRWMPQAAAPAAPAPAGGAPRGPKEARGAVTGVPLAWGCWAPPPRRLWRSDEPPPSRRRRLQPVGGRSAGGCCRGGACTACLGCGGCPPWTSPTSPSSPPCRPTPAASRLPTTSMLWGWQTSRTMRAATAGRSTSPLKTSTLQRLATLTRWRSLRRC